MNDIDYITNVLSSINFVNKNELVIVRNVLYLLANCRSINRMQKWHLFLLFLKKVYMHHKHNRQYELQV